MTQRTPSDLRPHPTVQALHRWDKASDEFKSLTDSIREHGVMVPLIITADARIMDGITRWQAAMAVGLQSIPVIVRAETDLVAVAIGTETERRHLSKGQLAFKYYPLIASTFAEKAELKAQQNGLPNDERGGLAHSVRSAEKRVADFARKLGISTRLLEQARELHTLFDETDQTPFLWTSAEAVKLLVECGMDPAMKHTARDYFSAAIMLSAEPMSLGGALAGLKFRLEAAAAEARGRAHTGGKPACPDRQLRLFARVIDDEITRWDYWESATDEQRETIFNHARKQADALPADRCAAIAQYHQRLARLFGRMSKES